MQIDGLDRDATRALVPLLATGWRTAQTWELKKGGLVLTFCLENDHKRVSRQVTLEEVVQNLLGPVAVISETWRHMGEEVIDHLVAAQAQRG